MKLDQMDELLIQIQNIKELSDVKVYDFVTNKSDKLEVVPGLMITYNGNKSLNLCLRDKYFDVYVKKVVEVYNDEKNNIIEDNLTDPFKRKRHIKIDEHSKEILESGRLENINDLYKFYDGKYSYDNSLLFQIDEVKLLIPIVKYHLKNFFDKTSLNINFKSDLKGYRNIYNIDALVNNINKNIIFSYLKESDNKYEFLINGIFDKNTPIKMNIEFLDDKININLSLAGLDLTYNASYVINDTNIKETINIYRGYKCVYNTNKDLEQVQNDKFDYDSSIKCNYFKLPWNALYASSINKDEISEIEKVINVYSAYICDLSYGFNKKESYSRSYLRNNTVAVRSEKIILDQMQRNTNCINLFDDYYLVETNFMDVKNLNGYYDGNLRRKYFYHLVKARDIRDIKAEDMKNINIDDIYEKTDLLNEDKVMKLLGGKTNE